MASVVAFLESKLRLKVNRAKSAVAPVRGAFLPRSSPDVRRAARSCTEKPRPGQGAASTHHPAQPGHRARTNDRGSEQLYHRLGDVLPPGGLQERTAGFRRMASSQAPLRASQAMQACQVDRRLPHEVRRAGKTGMAAGRLGQGMVASVRQSAGPRSHDVAVVCAARTRQSPSPSRRAASCWKPPSTMSTLGGVRGGNREESPYSIDDAARALSVLIKSKPGSGILIEHDLFRKPVTTRGSSPRANFFGIMLQSYCVRKVGAANNAFAPCGRLRGGSNFPSPACGKAGANFPSPACGAVVFTLLAGCKDG